MHINIMDGKIIAISSGPQPEISGFREATLEDQPLIDQFYLKQSKLNELSCIEKSITPRRIREAIMGVDSGWLEQKESEISAIRQTL